ncbi:exocyst complex component 6B-like [Crotalus adamanteus]|uniref:Exocyst complex component 6B-like n=1 Tax=Crotalus adamanteus TaxID=8729 RepID=A0AAW1B8H2_CROAD
MQLLIKQSEQVQRKGRSRRSNIRRPGWQRKKLRGGWQRPRIRGRRSAGESAATSPKVKAGGPHGRATGRVQLIRQDEPRGGAEGLRVPRPERLLIRIGHCLASAQVSRLQKYLRLDSEGRMKGKVAQTACMSACKHLSTSLMQQLLEAEVRQLSLGALQQFSLDVAECEQFARSGPVPGFQGDTLLLAFIDLRQDRRKPAEVGGLLSARTGDPGRDALSGGGLCHDAGRSPLASSLRLLSTQVAWGNTLPPVAWVRKVWVWRDWRSSHTHPPERASSRHSSLPGDELEESLGPGEIPTLAQKAVCLPSDQLPGLTARTSELESWLPPPKAGGQVLQPRSVPPAEASPPGSWIYPFSGGVIVETPVIESGSPSADHQPGPSAISVTFVLAADAPEGMGRHCQALLAASYVVSPVWCPPNVWRCFAQVALFPRSSPSRECCGNENREGGAQDSLSVRLSVQRGLAARGSPRATEALRGFFRMLKERGRRPGRPFAFLPSCNRFVPFSSQQQKSACLSFWLWLRKEFLCCWGISRKPGSSDTILTASEQVGGQADLAAGPVESCGVFGGKEAVEVRAAFSFQRTLTLNSAWPFGFADRNLQMLKKTSSTCGTAMLETEEKGTLARRIQTAAGKEALWCPPCVQRAFLGMGFLPPGVA